MTTKLFDSTLPDLRPEALFLVSMSQEGEWVEEEEDEGEGGDSVGVGGGKGKVKGVNN